MALETATYTPAIQLPVSKSESTTNIFPLSLSPSGLSISFEDVLSETGRLSQSGELHKLLDKHGAIYFQNLGLKDAEQFSRFAHSFGWTAHEDIGNPVRRTIHTKNVATANEGPNTQPVYPHNEFGLSPHYPSYVLFFCLSAPETGELLGLDCMIGADAGKVARHQSMTRLCCTRGCRRSIPISFEISKQRSVFACTVFGASLVKLCPGREVSALLSQRAKGPDRVCRNNSQTILRPPRRRLR